MKKNMKLGYVVMLDVLGFREYVSKSSGIDFFDIWKKIKKDLFNEKKSLEKDIDGFTDFWSLDVLCLADTLVLCLSCKDGNVKVTESAIAHIGISLESFFFRYFLQGIFFRGAISFGSFICDSKNNIAMGSAIDEAYEWHDSTDWIGVILAPSAKFTFDKVILDLPNDTPLERELTPKFVEYAVPFKFPTSFKTCAFVWFPIPDLSYDKGLTLIRILSVLSKRTYSKSFINKYANTLEFITTQLNINIKDFRMENTQKWRSIQEGDKSHNS